VALDAGNSEATTPRLLRVTSTALPAHRARR
jgi:hypothetical protein